MKGFTVVLMLIICTPNSTPMDEYLQGMTVIKPIIYGNIAKHFGKKREEDGHTHQVSYTHRQPNAGLGNR